MSVVALPILNDGTPHYEFECELEGVTYSFDLAWNDRDGAWYMQIGDGNQNLLCGSLRVVLGKFFTIRYRNAALFPGQLLCVDTSGQNTDPGLLDLGARVQIWYYDSASVASLLATGSP